MLPAHFRQRFINFRGRQVAAIASKKPDLATGLETAILLRYPRPPRPNPLAAGGGALGAGRAPTPAPATGAPAPLVPPELTSRANSLASTALEIPVSYEIVRRRCSSARQASMLCIPCCPPVWIADKIWCVFPSRIRFRTAGVAIRNS